MKTTWVLSTEEKKKTGPKTHCKYRSHVRIFLTPRNPTYIV